MKKSLPIGFFVCMMLGLTLFAEPPDTSTPKKAGVAFAKAVENGDMDAAKKLATGSDAEWNIVKKLSAFSVAMHDLQKVMTKKFGEAGKLPDEMLMNLAADFETTEERITGDTAILYSKQRPADKFPPTLKKAGNGWKMDLSNMSQDPSTETATKMMEFGTKRLAAITPKVEAGEYKDKEQVMAAMNSPKDP